MKIKKLFIFYIFLTLTICYSEEKNQFFYSFNCEKPTRYEINLKGSISYQYYEGIKPDVFDVSITGNLLLISEKLEEEVYGVKIFPMKTSIKINEEVIEDITYSETLVSSFIPTTKINIKKNGEIIETKDISPGISSMSPLFKLLPIFPEKIIPGTKWKQTIPKFEILGLPVSSLEFWYIYENQIGEIANFNFFSNQIIKEKENQKDLIITSNGTNISSGKILFNTSQGEIESFTGNFNIKLKIVFSIPPESKQKKSTKETLPLSFDVNLQFTLKKL